jgi:hypothetical protein
MEGRRRIDLLVEDYQVRRGGGGTSLLCNSMLNVHAYCRARKAVVNTAGEELREIERRNERLVSVSSPSYMLSPPSPLPFCQRSLATRRVAFYEMIEALHRDREGHVMPHNMQSYSSYWQDEMGQCPPRIITSPGYSERLRRLNAALEDGGWTPQEEVRGIWDVWWAHLQRTCA